MKESKSGDEGIREEGSIDNLLIRPSAYVSKDQQLQGTLLLHHALGIYHKFQHKC